MKCYGLYDENDVIIAFIAVIPQPHPKHKRLRRISRLVVLLDYQGIGIGYKFLNAIGQIYVDNNYDITIVTSAKNMVMKMAKENDWRLIRKDKQRKSKTGAVEKAKKTSRTENITASFMKRR